MKLTLLEDRHVRVTSSESLIIPDNDPQGIASELPIDRDGQVQDINVSVDISHTWIGDLRVSLVAPSGFEADLHRYTGREADNIIEVYDVSTTPGLAELVRSGQTVEGVWRLKAADFAQRDVGKLNSWGMDITVGE